MSNRIEPLPRRYPSFENCILVCLPHARMADGGGRPLSEMRLLSVMGIRLGCTPLLRRDPVRGRVDGLLVGE
jgi:hypothetical protein